MISAERMKSVRIAPATIVFSCSGPISAAVLTSAGAWWLSFSHTLWAPS